MRIALISDIHGNLLALDAVLAELEHESFDRLICLGDVAVGPQPREALARVRELDCPVIMGNWDAAFVEGMPPAGDPVMQKLVDVGAFWAGALEPADRDYIRTFMPTLEVELDGGGTLLCYHGSPNSYNDWLFATTPDDEVARMLDGFDAPLMAGGHTHLQMMRRREQSVLVNPGSVGLPFRRWWPNTIRIAPRAEYGLLTVGAGALSIDLRRTGYDVEAMLQLCRESGMPHADWWIESWTGD
jgi:predicted phosphodiesterase